MTKGEMQAVATAIGIGVVVYFSIGWGWMKRDLPYAWDRAVRAWTARSQQKSSALTQSICMVLFWFIVGPVREIQRVVLEHDPHELERRAWEAEEARKQAEQERRRMERELDRALKKSQKMLDSLKDEK